MNLTIKNVNQNQIFRKPTQTHQMIHQKSHHPYQHKIAAYRHMIHRLNSIPMSDENYQIELGNIKYIAHKNGYQTAVIERMNYGYKRRMEYRGFTSLNYDVVNKKYISMDWGHTSNKTQRIFQHFGYTLAHKTNNKLEKLIKNRSNATLDTGVYKLTCSDCQAFYLGQTGRSFKERFKEHVKSIGKINPESKFAQHINSTQHNYTNFETNLQVIHRMKKGDVLSRNEEFEIYKNKDNRFMLNNKINTATNKLYDLILNMQST